MSNFVEKDNKKERQFLEGIRKGIEEERKDNASLGLLLDKSIEAQNKIWLIKNKGSMVDLPKYNREQTVENYIVLKKSEDFLKDKVSLNDENVIGNFIDALKEKYHNLEEINLDDPNDGEIKVNINGEEQTINAFSGIEDYIVNLDPNYTKVVEETVISCFNKFHEKEPEETIETKDTTDTTRLNILTLDEVVEALSGYTVINKKLVHRGK